MELLDLTKLYKMILADLKNGRSHTNDVQDSGAVTQKIIFKKKIQNRDGESENEVA